MAGTLHTPEEHRAWAKQNEAVFGAFRKKWPDWAITALFYVAVHEVQALLIEHGHRPTTHRDRNAIVRTKWKKTVWPPYESLQSDSEDARYERWMPDEAALTRALLTLAKFRAEVDALPPPSAP